MNQRLMKYTALIATLLGMLILAGCGGQAATTAPVAPPADPRVKPLTGPEAQGDMGIKNADGTAPCGVFNVDFGDKKAVLADFPGCTAASYQVMCLDDKAQWQSTYISKVALSTDKKEVTFTSQQGGACGLFPGK